MNLLPDDRFSSLGFVILGILAESPCYENDLVDRLLETGWNPRENDRSLKLIRAAAKATFRRLEDSGLILSTDISKTRLVQLTSAGFLHWQASYDFCARAVKRWADLRVEKKPADFIALSAPPPKAGRHKLVQRPPSLEERAGISRISNLDFRLIFDFSGLSNIRATDLINAKIEKINWQKNTLELEERSVTNRFITDRIVSFETQAAEVLRQAVANRFSGEIFLQKNGQPWNEASLSAAFRKYRNAANVSNDVVLSGRGGKVGKTIEETISRELVE